MAATRPISVMHHARGQRAGRHVLRVFLILALLVGAGGGAAYAVGALRGGQTQLTVFWWGGNARATITDKVLDLYSQTHPNVVFKKQWQGYTGYYDKLGSMSGSGKAPDLFQLDDNGLTQFATRGMTLNLQPYMADVIRVDQFPEALKHAGDVDGHVAGIAGAENTAAMVFDRTMVQQLDLPLPTVGMSWTSAVDWAVRVYQRSGGKKYGLMNPSGDYKAFQVWLRQQGKDLYQGGNLGFTQDDLTRWLRFWADAAARHATPPAAIVHVANAGDVSKQLVETGQAAVSFVWSNQLEELQKGTQHQLGLVTYPGDVGGQWLRASMYWAASSSTHHADVVADVINFLVNNQDAGKLLGAERGLAPNLSVRSQTAPLLTSAMQTSASFETSLAAQVGNTPPPPPVGHSQIRTALMTAAESVEYGKASPAAAATQFFKQAKGILSQ